VAFADLLASAKGLLTLRDLPARAETAVEMSL